MNESRYSAFARELLAYLNADAVVLVVVGGEMGHGATRAEKPAPPEVLDARRTALAGALRLMADNIEKGITQPDQAWAKRGSS